MKEFPKVLQNLIKSQTKEYLIIFQIIDFYNKYILNGIKDILFLLLYLIICIIILIKDLIIQLIKQISLILKENN